MITKLEFIGAVVLFAVNYLILYADHKMSKKCNCEDCYLNDNVSFKIPVLVTLIIFIFYKIMKPITIAYLNNVSMARQEIITDMADF